MTDPLGQLHLAHKFFMELMIRYYMEALATAGPKEEEDIARNQDIQVQKAGEIVVIMAMVGIRSMDSGGLLRTEKITLHYWHICINFFA